MTPSLSGGGDHPSLASAFSPAVQCACRRMARSDTPCCVLNTLEAALSPPEPPSCAHKPQQQLRSIPRESRSCFASLLCLLNSPLNSLLANMPSTWSAKQRKSPELGSHLASWRLQATVRGHTRPSGTGWGGEAHSQGVTGLPWGGGQTPRAQGRLPSPSCLLKSDPALK